MSPEQFQEIATTIPHQPGIYKYFGASGELLYVGKAKDLRKRVGSYFTRSQATNKTRELVRRIDRIEFTIVNSEQDAFLLENNLIKQYLPKYNIELKDDKTYPYLVIKKEPFPRVFFTRQKHNDGSEYLGPYTSVKKVRELLEFIRQTIPLRTCALNLQEKNIARGKFRVCLEYHLGNCKGPCEGYQSEDDYRESIAQVRNLLRGNLAPVIRHFREEMKGLAAGMAFEKAELVRRKIEFLENYRARSVVANSKGGDVDVFSLSRESDRDGAYVNFLMVRNGTIIQTHTARVEARLEETDAEILQVAIAWLRDSFRSDAPEIVVPVAMDFPESGIRVTLPRGGDKKQLLELSLKNAAHYIRELREKSSRFTRASDAVEDLLGELQADLQLSSLPMHIECFDNSHFQGSYPVSAMVCFRQGKPSKADYRHFNVKTVEGIDDFATMKEAVYRRYKRLKEENADLPQLVIIDGGKGQLGAALEAVHDLQLDGHMTLVGLAKNEEELFFAGDKESLRLPFNSSSLRFIRRIRDEVHRFGITFHRQQRSRGTFKNELETIKGIGAATAELLLKEFRSVKKVREQSPETLAKLIGKAKAGILANYFSRQSAEN